MKIFIWLCWLTVASVLKVCGNLQFGAITAVLYYGFFIFLARASCTAYEDYKNEKSSKDDTNNKDSVGTDKIVEEIKGEDSKCHTDNLKINDSFNKVILDNTAENAKKSKRICPKCGAILPEDIMFCSVCGEKLDSNSYIICRYCGKENPKDNTYCLFCGKKIGNTKKKMTFLISIVIAIIAVTSVIVLTMNRPRNSSTENLIASNTINDNEAENGQIENDTGISETDNNKEEKDEEEEIDNYKETYVPGIVEDGYYKNQFLNLKFKIDETKNGEKLSETTDIEKNKNVPILYDTTPYYGYIKPERAFVSEDNKYAISFAYCDYRETYGNMSDAGVYESTYKDSFLEIYSGYGDDGYKTCTLAKGYKVPTFRVHSSDGYELDVYYFIKNAQIVVLKIYAPDSGQASEIYYGLDIQTLDK